MAADRGGKTRDVKPKRRRISPQWGWTGEAVPSEEPIRPLKSLAKDEPRNVDVHSTRTTPAASEVFSPNELEARLEAYAEILAQGESLFEDGSEPDETVRNACWGCGETPPLREDGTQPMATKMPGWVVMERAGNYLVEIWCPECAAMPGFGCVEEPEPEEEDRGSPSLAPSADVRNAINRQERA